jgi:hypothetical protein
MSSMSERERVPPATIAAYFRAPEGLAGDLSGYRSPLRFEDGSPVRTAADWRRRRAEIPRIWHAEMGPWPAPLRKPRIDFQGRERREGLTQYRVRVDVAPDRTSEAYLLMPDGRGPFPAVITVFYEPETGIGRGGVRRDFSLQLARRGFIALSMGRAYTANYPEEDEPVLQPLSYLAYLASNGRRALAALPEVDPKRIGITGHSYGGKWAMFASCLDEGFACAVWSDPGIGFDEKRSNVNYWEPWYLGFERGRSRKRGVITPDSPRTGAYERLVAAGRDLHELHALMAPRPFLVSGGSEDPPERWRALNHSVAVNRLLGHENRVAMTNRPMHDPTPESNEALCTFLEWWLRP